jgi:hypothetical protein
MADDVVVLDRYELDGIEPGRTQVFDQPRFVVAAEGVVVQLANGRVVGRRTPSDLHLGITTWSAGRVPAIRGRSVRRPRGRG